MKKEKWDVLFSVEKVAQQQLSGIVFRYIQQEPVNRQTMPPILISVQQPIHPLKQQIS